MTTLFPVTDAAAEASLATIASTVATAAKQPALNGDGGSLAHVTNFPATQPVSAASLPLPTGAATAALQPALNGDGGALAHVTNFPATQPVSGTVAVSNLPVTQAVSATTLPLPTGAATAALQPALNGDGGSLAHVTNFPATQPVSGSVSVSNFPSNQNVTAVHAFTPTGGSGAGTITTANTDQIILSANAARQFLMIQNTHATQSLVLCLTGISTSTAGAPNITLQAGQSIILDVAVPNTAIHAQSSTSGTTYSVIEG